MQFIDEKLKGIPTIYFRMHSLEREKDFVIRVSKNVLHKKRGLEQTIVLYFPRSIIMEERRSIGRRIKKNCSYSYKVMNKIVRFYFVVSYGNIKDKHKYII